jgi:hypothetical protein
VAVWTPLARGQSQKYFGISLLHDHERAWILLTRSRNNPILKAKTNSIGNSMIPSQHQQEKSPSSYAEDDDDDVKIIHPTNKNLTDVMESSHVDSLIAQQMSKLSMYEREQAYFDIHGITNITEETPEMIQTCMDKLDEEITRLQETAAYEQALSRNPMYVQEYAFRLKFLRADRFDAKKAALRLARHFEAKLELFGPSKLVQDITQSDLQEGDMDAMVVLIGHLPVRDSVGRLVRLTISNEDDRFMTSTDGVVSIYLSCCCCCCWLILFFIGLNQSLQFCCFFYLLCSCEPCFIR